MKPIGYDSRANDGSAVLQCSAGEWSRLSGRAAEEREGTRMAILPLGQQGRMIALLVDFFSAAGGSLACAIP